MPNLLRNQSVIFFAIVYEISKSVIPLSNSVIMYLVIGPNLRAEPPDKLSAIYTASYNYLSQPYQDQPDVFESSGIYFLSVLPQAGLKTHDPLPYQMLITKEPSEEYSSCPPTSYCL